MHEGPESAQEETVEDVATKGGSSAIAAVGSTKGAVNEPIQRFRAHGRAGWRGGDRVAAAARQCAAALAH